MRQPSHPNWNDRSNPAIEFLGWIACVLAVLVFGLLAGVVLFLLVTRFAGLPTDYGFYIGVPILAIFGVWAISPKFRFGATLYFYSLLMFGLIWQNPIYYTPWDKHAYDSNFEKTYLPLNVAAVSATVAFVLIVCLEWRRIMRDGSARMPNDV